MNLFISLLLDTFDSIKGHVNSFVNFDFFELWRSRRSFF